LFSLPYLASPWTVTTYITYICNHCVGESLNVIEYTIPNASSVVTSVVLVAPSSDTHTRNMHQRLVGLRIVESSTEEPADSGKSVSVQGPPNANIAPPGLYMLFLLNGDVYGQAKWVKVQA